MSWKAWSDGTRPWARCVAQAERWRQRWVAGDLEDSEEPADLHDRAGEAVDLRSVPASRCSFRPVGSRRRSKSSGRARSRGHRGDRRKRRRRSSSPVCERSPDRTDYGPRGGPHGGVQADPA